MRKGIFITFISRGCISKEVYTEFKKRPKLKRKNEIYLNTITVTLYAAGILIFTVYKVKQLKF